MGPISFVFLHPYLTMHGPDNSLVARLSLIGE